MNTASGTTLGPIGGLVSLTLDINDQTFVQILIICKKMKQPLIMGLDFSQRYKLDIDWDAYGTLFLRYKGERIATTIKKVIHVNSQ